MELKITDYESITLIIDDIRYELTKNHLGFSIIRLDDEGINVHACNDGKIEIDGEQE